ncbi:MAG: Glu/Leu/Phe/Val dehydrogenase dimerization domain-containing protein, partial [Nitrospinaceae bacterium]
KLPNRLTLDPLPEKIVDGRFSGENDLPPEQRCRILDPETGRVWGFVVVDNTRRGPGLGGIRLAEDLTLEEVSRLARVMTLKNSGANLPFGGGKAGLVGNPSVLNENPGLKSDLISLFAEAIFPLDSYIPAPDMGTDEQDLQTIQNVFTQQAGSSQKFRGVSGRPTEQGGIPIDEWGLTAHGLFAAAETLERLDDKFTLKGSRVVVQGYGNVGSWTAVKLRQAGAILVGASDIHAGLWNPQGLDVEELNAVRHTSQGLRNYKGRIQTKFEGKQVDWLLEAPCDILVPAARPDAVTSKNADRIQCRVILQGANTPSSKMTEYYLKNRRGILSLNDFIVNVGGVIGCGVELKMGAEPDYREKVLKKGIRLYLEELIYGTVSRNVEEIFRRLKDNPNQDKLFREEALKLSEERLGAAQQELWL